MAEAPLVEHESVLPASERGHALIYFTLLSLAGPVSEVADGQARPTWLSALALAAFVACVAVAIETGQHWRGGWREVSQRRRRLHYTAVAALGPVAVAAALAFGQSWLVLFVFVAVTTVLTVPDAWAMRTDAVVATLMMVVELAHGWNVTNLATGAGWALAVFVVGYIALMLKRRAVLIRDLHEAQGQVARLAAADAVAQERLRFARDLHDLLGHSLSVIVLKTELAGTLFDGGATERGRAELSDAEQIARRSLAEVREAVSGYRRQSLGAEFGEARAAMEAAGIEVSITKTVSGLPADVDDLLGWVVREAATNIVRHSQARHAEIELVPLEGGVRLEVRDDGVGTPGDAAAIAPGGSGLLGLRERVAEVGGRLDARPRPSGGFALAVTVPLGGTVSKTGAPVGGAGQGAQR